MKEVENKFIVINTKDLEHLTEEGKEKLYTIIYAIEKARKMHNKKINNYWVCNQDEPYAEQVKNLILSDGEASQLEPPVSGQQLAEQFHKLYEELAPQFGYKTKEETKIFSPESNNGKLMIAVSEQILKWLSR